MELLNRIVINESPTLRLYPILVSILLSIHLMTIVSSTIHLMITTNYKHHYITTEKMG